MSKGYVVAFVLGAFSFFVVSTFFHSEHLQQSTQTLENTLTNSEKSINQAFSQTQQPLESALKNTTKSLENTLSTLSKSALIEKVILLEDQLATTTQKQEQLIEEVTQQSQNLIKQKVAELEQQMQQQIDTLLSEGSDGFNLALQFEQQTRDDNWAENTEAVLSDFFSTHDFIDDVKLNNIKCRTSICQVNYEFADNFESSHLFTHRLSQFITKHNFGSTQSQENNGVVNMHIAK